MTVRNLSIIAYPIGVPVAWAMMDREDVPVLEEYFKCVQENVLDAVISTLMTDDGIKQNDK